MNKEIVTWSDIIEPRLQAINLELTAHCNLRCSFCLNPKIGFRKKGFISWELINKLINEVDSNVKINICGIGEPALHPDFAKIINALTEKFNDVSIVTNGQLFKDEKAAEAVLNSNIKKIFFSMDYIDPIVYKQEKDGNLDEVISGLKQFLILRDKYENPPMIQINYLWEKEKQDYLESIKFFREIMKEPWCFYMRKIKTLGGQVDIEINDDEDLLDNMFSDQVDNNVQVENWNRYLAHTNFKTQKPLICRHIYSYYMLLWNGDIVPCCVDFNGTMVMGNMLVDNQYSLMEIFNSDKYNAFRKDMEQLNYKNLPLCQKCEDYYRC